jgi:hypothetical protein
MSASAAGQPAGLWWLRKLAGQMVGSGWAGCKAKGVDVAQNTSLPLANQKNRFVLWFEIEFEFDSHSNSNFTQLNSK